MEKKLGICHNCSSLFSPTSLFDMKLENFAYAGQQVNFRECFTFCTGSPITEAFPKVCSVCLVLLRQTYIAKKDGGIPLAGLKGIRKMPLTKVPSTSFIVQSPLAANKKIPTQQVITKALLPANKKVFIPQMQTTPITKQGPLPKMGANQKVFTPQRRLNPVQTVKKISAGPLPGISGNKTPQIPLRTVQATQVPVASDHIQLINLAPSNIENVCLNCFKICNPTDLVNMRETRFNLNGRLINFMDCYTFCTKRAFVANNTQLMICYTCLTQQINEYEQKQPPPPTVSSSTVGPVKIEEVKPTPQILDIINLDSSEDETPEVPFKSEPELQIGDMDGFSNQYFTNFDTGQVMLTNQDKNTEAEIKIEPKIEEDVVITYTNIVEQACKDEIEIKIETELKMESTELFVDKQVSDLQSATLGIQLLSNIESGTEIKSEESKMELDDPNAAIHLPIVVENIANLEMEFKHEPELHIADTDVVNRLRDAQSKIQLPSSNIDDTIEIKMEPKLEIESTEPLDSSTVIDQVPGNSEDSPSEADNEKICQAFKCQQCSIVLPSMVAMRTHLSTHASALLTNCNDNGTENLMHDQKCIVCGLLFVSISEMQLHARKHTECPICADRFDLPKLLEDHMASHSKIRTYQCATCAQQFETEYNLTKHLCIATALPFQFAIKDHLVQRRTCSVCGFLFESSFEMQLHLKKHTECPICDRKFDQPKRLEDHMVLHSKTKTYECAVCCRQYQTNHNLTIHVSTHDRVSVQVIYKCSKCPKEFKNRTNYLIHQNKHLPSYECALCSKKFKNRNRIQIHMSIHRYYKTVKCQYCQETLDNKRILQCHMEIHDGKVECSVRQEMINKRGLMQHLKTHYEMYGYQCYTCCRFYKTKYQLSIHLQRSRCLSYYKCKYCKLRFETCRQLCDHSRTHKRVYTCAICQLQTTVMAEYRSHIAAAHTANQKAFPCPKCKKIFSTYKAIQYHVLYTHGEKLYQCHHCTKRFVLKSSLKSHMQYLHFKSQQKLFKCLQCPEVYKIQTCFRDHMLYHAGLRYECADCSATFPTKPELRRHLVSHTDLPLKMSLVEPCVLCGKVFNPQAMIRHLKIHSNFSPHKCNQCGIVFGSYKRFESHMNRTHRRKIHCPICNRLFFMAYTLKHHVKKFHNLDSLLFCQYCDTCFATQSDKMAHMATDHGSKEQQAPLELAKNLDKQHYGCHHCWSRFTTKAAIERHLLTKHYKTQGTGKSKMFYDCDESGCDKQYSRHQYLQGHMIVHSGKSHFQCDYCALAFTRKPKLLKHFAVREQNGKCTF